MSKQGMVDIALLEEMYTRICEENGLQILCSKALSRLDGASRIWWGLIERAVGFSGC
jgi:hypothetical protein